MGVRVCVCVALGKYTPVCVMCTRSGGSIRGRRTCPPGRNWLYVPRRRAAVCSSPAGRNDRTRSCCDSD